MENTEVMTGQVEIKYLMPDKVKLELDFLLAYKKEFLAMNDLNVGDKIVWNFQYEQLRTNYGGRGQTKYTFDKKCEGVLKEDEHGCLIIESLENMTFYWLNSNGYSGRSRREWYECVKRPSIYKFGTGFVL